MLRSIPFASCGSIASCSTSWCGRDIKVRYKQSVLGGLWAIIQPFFTMVVFTLFFHKLAGIDSGDTPYPIFSYSALLPWTYFSGSITQIGNSLVSNQHLITKVYFPRITIPASNAIRGLVDLAIASAISGRHDGVLSVCSRLEPSAVAAPAHFPWSCWPWGWA